jgi:tetratricopeptide (TPR) repeat protein
MIAASRFPMPAVRAFLRQMTLVLAVALGAQGAWCTLSCGAVPDFVLHSEWTEVRSPHFVVTSDAGSGPALDMARRLERLVQAMAQVNPEIHPVPSSSIQVVGLRDTGEVRRYGFSALMENAAGFQGSGITGIWIVLATSGPAADRAEILYHEYAHACLGATFATLPLWLNEGLADYYGATRITDDWAEVGRASTDRVEWNKQQETMSLDALFAMTTQARAYLKNNATAQSFYAESWNLAHYLQSPTSGRSERFAQFLGRLRSGVNARVAFLAAFGADDWAKLPTESKAYLDRIAFEPTRRIPFTERLENVSMQQRTMAGPEVLDLLGSLVLTYGPEHSADARDHFKAAVALDSTNARAIAALGYLDDLEGDAGAAERSYGRAQTLAPNDARPLLMAGLGTLERARLQNTTPNRDGSTPPLLLAARERLSRSLALDGQSIEALTGFGRTFVMDARADSAAIRALEKALDMMPGRTDIAANLAMLETRVGDRQAAERLIHDRVAPSVSPGETREVQRAATAIDAERATAAYRSAMKKGLEAANSGDPDGAIQWLAQARDSAPDPQLRHEADSFLVRARVNRAVSEADAAMRANRLSEAKAKLDEALALPLAADDGTRVEGFRAEVEARLISVQAVALARAGKLREARQAFAKILSLPVGEEAKSYARKRIAEIDARAGGRR